MRFSIVISSLNTFQPLILLIHNLEELSWLLCLSTLLVSVSHLHVGTFGMVQEIESVCQESHDVDAENDGDVAQQRESH